MRNPIQRLLLLSGFALISAIAHADDDPLKQLLDAQAIFSPAQSTELTEEVQTAALSLPQHDGLDLFLKQELQTVVKESDPIGTLLEGEGVFSDDMKQAVVTAAFNYLNTPYKYGGNTVYTGFDCSGLVKAIYDEVAQTSLPRTAAAQADAAKNIRRTELEPGDLVFFKTVRNRKFSHVGIYVGDNKFIHAPSTGKQVRIEDMTAKYWNKRFTGARRVIE